MNDEIMKAAKDDSEMLKEYDFSKGRRGRYAQRYAEGTNVELLDPDVATHSDESELRSELWTWLVAAMKQLELAKTPPVFARRYQIWERVDSNSRTLIDRADLYVSTPILFELVTTQEWKRFEATLQSAPIGNKFNKFVATSRGGFTLSAAVIASRFLETQLRLDESRTHVLMELDRAAFNDQFSGFVTLLKASKSRVVDSIYIARMRLGPADAAFPLVLDSEVSVHNVEEAQNLELLQSRFSSHPHLDFLYDSDQHFIRIDRTFELPIYVDETAVATLKWDRESDIKFDAVLKTFALETADVVAVVAKKTIFPSEFAFFGESTNFDPERAQVYPPKTLPIDAASLKTIYRLVVAMASDGSQFELPLRYLLSSTTRRDPVDQFVDLVVACEAMFMENKDKSGEIRHKIALRMGALLRTTVDDRLAVFKTMRAAYDIRSEIVHGSKPRGDLGEQVALLRSLVRESLIKLGKLHPRKKPSEIMWIRLLFGEKLASNEK